MHDDDITTTHAGYGEGHPRLVLAVGDRPWTGERQPVFDLRHEITRIGSGPDVDVRLPDVAPLHAEVLHDENDEYVLLLLAAGEAPAEGTGSPTDRPPPQVLRTGGTFRLGPWALSFERDERADHGRPYGGRQGGEGSVQTFQPPHPDYSAEHERAWDQEERGG